MVCRRDLEMYLLAIKSAYRQVGMGTIVCLDDGSLTPSDAELLREQLGAEIRPLAAVDTGPIPKGGCWERLLTCIELSMDSYVIQLDADTLSLAAMPEVVTAVRENRSFTLGSRQGRRIVRCAEASAFASGEPGEHLQYQAERQLGDVMGAERGYVRGCAAFAGFGQGQHAQAALRQFSAQMQARLGADCWRRWGTEQVASNYTIANTPDPIVLQPEQYSTHGWGSLSTAVFVHFLGSNRFKGGTYARHAAMIIRRMQDDRAT